MAALDYRQVHDIYNSLRDAGAVTASMPDWAREMQRQTGSDLFSAGERDGWWTRTSNWLDQNVFEPVASVTTEPLIGAVGAAFGNEEAGRAVGRGLPRMALETAPLFIPGLGEVYGGALAAGLTGGLIGAHTYADTGSGKAALISGAAGAAMPLVGKLAGNVAARAAGAELVEGTTSAGKVLREYLAPTTAEAPLVNTARYLGSQTGVQLGTNVASSIAQQEVLNPNEKFNWSGFAVDTALSQIPFTVFDMVKSVRNPTPSAAEVRPGLQPLTTPTTKKTPTPSIPKAESPEARATLEALLEQHQEIVNSPEATQQDIADSWKRVLVGVNDPKAIETLKANTQNTKLGQDDVTLVGRARQTKDGNWKVFVEEPGTTNLKPEQTVFVNGATPTFDKETGTYRFDVKLNQINDAVTSPLSREHFIKPTDVNQPDLPIQAKPLAEDQSPFDALGSDTKKTLADAGVKIWNDEFLTADDEAKAEALTLKEHADSIEKAKADEAKAKAVIAKPIETAEDAVAVTKGHDTAEAEVKDTIKSGATPIQAVEKVRLQQQTPIVDQSQLEANLAALAAKGVASKAAKRTKARVSEDEQKGQQLIDAYSKLDPETNPEAATVVKMVQEYATKGAHRSNIQNLLLREVARNQTDLPKLRKKFEAIVAGTDNRSRGAGIPKADGVEGETPAGRVIMTEAEAAATLAAQSEDVQKSHEVVAVNRAKDEFKVQPKITSRDVSLDAPVAEDTDATLYNVFASENERDVRDVVDAAFTERPTKGIESLVSALDAAGKFPQVFMNEAGFEDIPDALTAIRQARVTLPLMAEGDFGKINAALNAAKIKPFATEREMLTRMKQVREGADVVNNLQRNFTLGSTQVYDKELVNRIGVLRPDGLRRAVEWYAAHPDSGTMGIIANDLMHATALDNVPIIYDPKRGWYYSRQGKINVPYMPENESHALNSWMPNLVHELAHHAARDLVNRNDPAAIKFKATLEEVRQALRNSPKLDKAIRDNLAKSDKWYEEYAASGDGDAYYNKWKKAIGRDKFVDNYAVIYGLHNTDELLAQAFSAPEMVALLKQTQMPKSIGQTVMQFFSNAWNKIFHGDKPETKDALAHIFSGFSDYLGGTKIRPQGRPVTLDIPAGPGLLYGLATFDEQRNTLGGKHTLPKSGVITEQVLKNIGGLGKPLSDAEMQLYRTVVPEAFGEKGVDVKKLVQGLKEKGPVVEVKKLGEDTGGTLEQRQIIQRFNEVQHRLETAGVQYRGMSENPGANTWFPKFTIKDFGTGWLDDRAAPTSVPKTPTSSPSTAGMRRRCRTGRRRFM
jgi:hypothetical protein